MFAKSVVPTTLFALAAAAIATQTPASQCATGDLQCCQSSSSTITSALAELLALLGLDASGVALPVGVTCSPITAIRVGSGSTCTAQPVCCSDNSYNGVVALGCSPVDLSL